MQEDFHYYATYAAAYIAGYSHEESMEICYSAQFVDVCSYTLLTKLKAPLSAATTQLQLELMNERTDIVGLQNITRIWSSFHFLPRDLYAEKKKCGKRYRDKYRLICGPNGDLLVDTVNIAKNSSLQAVGIAMHVLADTWAHTYFAGTPSYVINNTDFYFYELLGENEPYIEKSIKFRHSPTEPDDIENSIYTNSLSQSTENSIMNLGHGRAGHLPDYSFAKYKYLPAWKDYDEVIKDNPADYMKAFCQMIYAMKYLRGEISTFEKETYAEDEISQWKADIDQILRKRQLNACEDWKKFGERLSGREIEDFSIDKYQQQYIDAPKKDKDYTYLGRFFIAAMRQKSMVTNKIYTSGNLIAGFSVDFAKRGFKGIRDYIKLLEAFKRNGNE
ncbi:hypothetical protein SAMN05216390_11941 [Lachnospiraceae bacterium KH1T2]|nr:hypothetical protein SAMN05216390_11941 [Lachnospiraceae bacterium KH1T2]